MELPRKTPAPFKVGKRALQNDDAESGNVLALSPIRFEMPDIFLDESKQIICRRNRARFENFATDDCDETHGVAGAGSDQNYTAYRTLKPETVGGHMKPNPAGGISLDRRQGFFCKPFPEANYRVQTGLNQILFSEAARAAVRAVF